MVGAWETGVGLGAVTSSPRRAEVRTVFLRRRRISERLGASPFSSVAWAVAGGARGSAGVGDVAAVVVVVAAAVGVLLMGVG